MTVKYHKRNTNFQIENFLMKGAHTIDNAYFQLLELKEERLRALDNHKVSKLRMDAKKALALHYSQSALEWERLNAEADLLEVDNELKYEKELYEACMDELANIERLIQELEPQRKYAHMDLISAHEAAQSDAWKIELIRRAENHMLTSGSIPADHFATMRLHPAFKDEILPELNKLSHAVLEARTNASPALLNERIIDNELKP